MQGSGYRPIEEHQPQARSLWPFSPCPQAAKHPGRIPEFPCWGKKAQTALESSEPLRSLGRQQGPAVRSPRAILLGPTCRSCESRGLSALRLGTEENWLRAGQLSRSGGKTHSTLKTPAPERPTVQMPRDKLNRS